MMLPQRKLLYHRGIDDSVGTYVTDYVISVVCFILFFYFVVLFIKTRNRTSYENGFAKSSYAISALLVFVGTAGLFGGLTHQYLQKVEPYTDWNDKISWLLVWRITSALSAGMAFVFLLLAQHLLTSENLLQFSKVASIIYYVIISLISAGIVFHSIWMITDEDPWSLSINFCVVFVCVAVESIVAAIALCKRFRSHCCDETTSTISVSATDTLSLNSSIENVDEAKQATEILKLTEVIAGQATRTPVYRCDLLFHFLAPTLFLIGGVMQFLLAKIAKCNLESDHQSYRCPLPSSFNHNAVLHLIHTASMVLFFMAELYAIRHRKYIFEEKTNRARESPI